MAEKIASFVTSGRPGNNPLQTTFSHSSRAKKRIAPQDGQRRGDKSTQLRHTVGTQFKAHNANVGTQSKCRGKQKILRTSRSGEKMHKIELIFSILNVSYI